MVAINRGFLERPVHALQLPIRPRMIYPGAAVVDCALLADAIEDMRQSSDGFVRLVIIILDSMLGGSGSAVCRCHHL